MFNDLLNEEITVKYPAGTFADGVTEYRECQAMAFVFDYNERMLKEIGMVKDAKFFIIAADENTLAAFAAPAGTIIVRGEKSYDVKTVRPCRNLDGQIECFSCAGV